MNLILVEKYSTSFYYYNFIIYTSINPHTHSIQPTEKNFHRCYSYNNNRYST